MALLRRAAQRWLGDRCDRLAAAVACYALFSLFPLALLSLTVLGYVLGDDAGTRRQIVSSLALTGSPELTALIDQTLASMQAHRTARGVGTVIGVVSVLLGASGVFGELQNAFDVIWRAPRSPTKGVWQAALDFARGKAVAFALVGLSAIVLLASLVASAAWSAFSVNDAPPLVAFLWHAGELVASAVFLAPVMALTYRVLVRGRIGWRELAVGASLSAALLSVLRKALAFYLAHLGSYAAYGVAGAVLGFLTWVYASAMVLFFAAEVTRVYAERRAVSRRRRA